MGGLLIPLLLLGYLIVKLYKITNAKSQAVGCDNAYTDAYCGIGKLILLSIFTLGIWSLIWIHRTTKFLNQAPDAEYHNPTKKLLLCMFVPFYQIYWYYKQAQKADAYAKTKNPNNSDIAGTCLVCAIFIPIVASVILQERINSICTNAVSPQKEATYAAPVAINTCAAQNSEMDVAASLVRYKELFDQGVITQEEFDAKKKQLLGM